MIAFGYPLFDYFLKNDMMGRWGTFHLQSNPSVGSTWCDVFVIWCLDSCRHSVGKHISILREPKATDFDPREKFWTRFPSEGSKLTPPHQSVEFRWKDYCPMVFRY